MRELCIPVFCPTLLTRICACACACSGRARTTANPTRNRAALRAAADRRDTRWLDVEQNLPGEGGEDSGGRRGLGGDSLYPRPELDRALGPWLGIRRVATSFCMDGVSVFPRKFLVEARETRHWRFRVLRCHRGLLGLAMRMRAGRR